MRRFCKPSVAAVGLLGLTVTLVGPPAIIAAQGQNRSLTTSIVGPPLGATIPDFSGSDQDGIQQNFATIRGPKGAVIYFHRSADWCIYCRMQLVQLEESRAALQRNGFGLCAISFDSAEALKAFAHERDIGFPLLSDPASEIIRRFGLLDESVAPGSPVYGVPVHGTLLVDENGVVQSRYFDGNVGHSAGVVLTRLFTSPHGTHERLVVHDHLRLKSYAAALQVKPGEPLELTIDITLNDDVFAFAGDTIGRAVGFTWEMDVSPAYSSQPVIFPQPQLRTMRSDSSKVAIHRGNVRLVRRVTLDGDPGRVAALMQPAGDLLIKGTLRFQVCNDTLCYAERKIPLRWSFNLADVPRSKSAKSVWRP